MLPHPLRLTPPLGVPWRPAPGSARSSTLTRHRCPQVEQNTPPSDCGLSTARHEPTRQRPNTQLRMVYKFMVVAPPRKVPKVGSLTWVDVHLVVYLLFEPFAESCARWRGRCMKDACTPHSLPGTSCTQYCMLDIHICIHHTVSLRVRCTPLPPVS